MYLEGVVWCAVVGQFKLHNDKCVNNPKGRANAVFN